MLSLEGDLPLPKSLPILLLARVHRGCSAGAVSLFFGGDGGEAVVAAVEGVLELCFAEPCQSLRLRLACRDFFVSRSVGRRDALRQRRLPRSFHRLASLLSLPQMGQECLSLLHLRHFGNHRAKLPSPNLFNLRLAPQRRERHVGFKLSLGFLEGRLDV